MTGSKGRAGRRVNASAPIAKKLCDRAGVGTVRACIGNYDVRIAIMVDGTGLPLVPGTFVATGRRSTNDSTLSTLTTTAIRVDARFQFVLAGCRDLMTVGKDQPSLPVRFHSSQAQKVGGLSPPRRETLLPSYCNCEGLAGKTFARMRQFLAPSLGAVHGLIGRSKE
jgi:hypothetical protein